MKRRQKNARYKTPIEYQIGDANPKPDINRSILQRISHKPVTIDFLKGGLTDYRDQKNFEPPNHLKQIYSSKEIHEKITKLLRNASNLPSM